LRTLLAVHIAGGCIALISMFIPMIARKGGIVHRRAGWVFVSGMTIVAITALLLAGARLLTDPTAQGRSIGAFLFYVAVLTGAGVSAGIRVLRLRRRAGPHRNAWDLGLPALLLTSAAAIAAYGVITGQTLFVAFSVIGLVNGATQLAYWLRTPTHTVHWWFEHMGNMLGACIAATTAFLVINAGRLGLETFSLVAWLAPSALGAPGIAIWTTYYRRRFRKSGTPAARHAAPSVSTV
jgi:hypothetical protein